MAKITVKLPQVGESVTEAVIQKWLVAPGDAIRRYDPLVEVITDKVNMEVPAPIDGTLIKPLVAEGETIKMGTPIAEIETSSESILPDDTTPKLLDASPNDQTASRIGSMIVGANVGPTGGEFIDTSLQSEPQPPQIDEPSRPPIYERKRTQDKSRDRRYSPVVLRLAKLHRIDLAEVQGSGQGERVTKRDLEAYIASRAAHHSPPQDELIRPSPIRRMIAENMSQSRSEIPHAWAAIEVDVTRLVKYRNAEMGRVAETTGNRLTYLHIILWHVAAALKSHRPLNASWDDGSIVLKGNVNIGIAVAASDGLIVPVLRNADRLNINDTVSETARLVEAARTGRLGVHDVQGGTFTLNNTGALGSVWGGAIINYPQAAILTTESIVKRPAVVSGPDGEDVIAIRSMMNMCLSFDHRVIDGAEAMAFLNDIKNRLESISLEANR